jgi:hypothetical protein
MTRWIAGGRAAVAAAAAVVAGIAAPSAARADYRDGCPTGAVARTFRVAQIGPAPDRESVLTPTRAELWIGNDYFTSRGVASRARLNTLVPHLQYNHEFDDGHAAIIEVWGKGLLRRPDDGLPFAALWGNTVVDLAYRWGHLAELDVHEHVEIPTLREVHAVQLFGGRSRVDPDPMASELDTMSLRSLALRSAFDGYLVNPGWVAGIALESRYEIVGCMAPFFHLRFAPSYSGMRDAIQIATLPISAAIGLAVSEDASIYVQYGLALRRYGMAPAFADDRIRLPDMAGTYSTQRVRLGFDWRGPADFHFGASIDYVSGQDGIFTGIYVMRGVEP